MCQLHARVVEAKDLPSFENTNLFATLMIDEEGHNLETEKNSSNNPNWNQEFDFNVTNRNAAVLKVRVLNFDGDIDEKIGKVLIPVNSIQELNKDVDQWYEIKNKGGDVTGSIHLVLTVKSEDGTTSDADLNELLKVIDSDNGINLTDEEHQKSLEPQKYLISFTVISAEDIDKLTESKNFDCTPDFYTVLQIKDRKRIDKTCCKIANFHPVWNQTFNYHILAKNLTIFNIKLKNHIVKEDKDTIVAETDFSFTDIPDDTVDYDSWIVLDSTTQQNEKCRLHVKIHFEPTEDLSEDEAKDSELEIQFDKNDLFPEHVNLNVTILEARDLPKVDLFSDADPYCLVQIGKSPHQTKIIPKSLSPNWNESFDFSVDNRSEAKLIITVIDSNKVASDKEMSKIEIPVASFTEFSNNWYDLQPIRNVKKGGRIHILVKTTDPSNPTSVIARDLKSSPQQIITQVTKSVTEPQTTTSQSTITSQTVSTTSTTVTKSSTSLTQTNQTTDSIPQQDQTQEVPPAQEGQEGTPGLNPSWIIPEDQVKTEQKEEDTPLANENNQENTEGKPDEKEENTVGKEEDKDKIETDPSWIIDDNELKPEETTEEKPEETTEEKPEETTEEKQEETTEDKDKIETDPSWVIDANELKPEETTEEKPEETTEEKPEETTEDKEKIETDPSWIIDDNELKPEEKPEETTEEKPEETTEDKDKIETDPSWVIDANELKPEETTEEKPEETTEEKPEETTEDKDKIETDPSWIIDDNELKPKETNELKPEETTEEKPEETTEDKDKIETDPSWVIDANELKPEEEKTEETTEEKPEETTEDKDEIETDPSWIVKENPVKPEEETTEEKPEETTEEKPEETIEDKDKIETDPSWVIDDNELKPEEEEKPEEATEEKPEETTEDKDEIETDPPWIVDDNELKPEEEEKPEETTEDKDKIETNPSWVVGESTEEEEVGEQENEFIDEDEEGEIEYTSSPRYQSSTKSKGPRSKEEKFEETMKSYIEFNMRKEQQGSPSKSQYSPSQTQREIVVEEEEVQEIPQNYDEDHFDEESSGGQQANDDEIKQEEEFQQEIEERKNEIKQIVESDAMRIYREKVLLPVQKGYNHSKPTNKPTDRMLFTNDKNLNDLKEKQENPENMSPKKLKKEIKNLEKEITSIDIEIEQLRREIADLE